MSQPQLLKEKDWDNLLILDAARFDVFKKVYPRFLHGKLIPVQTNSSCTEEWLAKNWTGKHDLTYVSGNPYVNSAGVPLRKYDGKGSINNYVARDHFKMIVDVWNFGWNDTLRTVAPKTMNEATLTMTNRSNLLVHYVQPHWPFIGKTRVISGDGTSLRNMVNERRCAEKKLEKYPPLVKHMSPRYVEQYRKAYEDNMVIVVKAVAQLAPHLKGKTVVSADHGEFLGEKGFYNHPCFYKHNLLRTVPWFTVEGER